MEVASGLCEWSDVPAWMAVACFWAGWGGGLICNSCSSVLTSLRFAVGL